MPPLGYKARTQDAVLWEANGWPDAYGKYTVSTPEEIKVRWEWVDEVSRDPQGNEVKVEARIDAGRYLPSGSVLYLGTLDDWYHDPGSGGANNGLVEVMGVESVPNTKGRFTPTEVNARRFRNTLPTVE